ncbi:MAG: response regulator transcription factor [Lachnospira sp.]|nr:response regulator transcription factor [Lachnospira sp.]
MKLLLAEDERELSRALMAVLKLQGCETDPAYDGEEAYRLAHSNIYDVMIFDIMMPKKDGITLLKQLRAEGNHTPVLLLTAKAEIENRVEGLDSGADDYLTKPFAMKELLARIRSLARRSSESYNPSRLQLGSVTLDTENLELKSETSVRLGSKEAELLEYFMQNPDKEIATEDLLKHVWREDEEKDPEIVWVYVSYLRKKLQWVGADLEIEGEHGGSFKLVQCRE